jgi:hypothetical protein
MLSSITPLGERGQGRRWGATAGWYLAGSVAGGTAVGFALGAAGGLLPLTPSAVALAIVVLAGAGTLVDLGLGRLPTIHRQVNEDWLRQYRSWVVGAGYGAQLGAGFVTIVTTAAVYLTFALAMLTGSALAGAAVGAVFGLSRALPVLAQRRATTAARVGAIHRRLEAWAPGARRAAVAAQGAVGLIAVVGLA